MLRLLLPFVLLSSASGGCSSRGLEERSLDAQVVLSAYTRTVQPSSRNGSSSYSAEFLVFNVVKGDVHVQEVYRQRPPSPLETALNRRLVNVSNLGDPSRCESDVVPGETYILLLDVADDGQLTARYDGAYGPAVLYSRDKEMALEAIGSWGEWSPCSGSCGGGIQQRRRECETKCSEDEGQQRTCNMFPCSSVLNVLDRAGVHRSHLHPPGRPSAFHLSAEGSWRSREEEVLFPRTFPWEFSLLVTVRLRPSFSKGGFLLRVLHSGSLQVGLYLSDIITLVLSDKNNIRVSFIKSLFDGHWHQLAFSVRRDTVSFYMNCEFSGKLPLPAKVRPFGGQPATLVVGSTGDHELDAFQGDIEQLTITGSPDAAEKQCNSTTQPINVRGGAYELRQEVRSRPLHTGTQNDWRGDDFTFDDQTDDSYDDYDEDKTLDDYRENKIPLKEDPAFDGDSDEDDEEEEDEKDDEEKDEEDDDEEKDEDDDEENDEDNDDDKERDEDEKDEDDDEKDDIINTTKEDNDNHKQTETNDFVDLMDITEEVTDDTTHRNDSDELKFKEMSSDEVTTSLITDEPLTETVKDFSYEDEHVDEEIDDDAEDDLEGSGAGAEIKLAWSEWSPCSATCNWGRRTRTSYCLDNGANLESCAEASAKRSDTEACFLRLCPSTLPFNASSSTAFPLVTPKPCRVRCSNGGTCQPPYKCSCPPGVYGSLCQYAKQACRVNCQNGATCLPPSTCVCQKGYFGSECQYAVCKPHCLNGGYCVAPNKCRCKPGYVGNFCHKAVCQHGCKNGGECVAPNKCACRSGFTGKDCSQPYCNPPCQNGGDCVKPYFCHCPADTRGAFCEKHVCNPDCQNGGICVGKGKCSCPRGFSGFLCEQDYCPGGGCVHGGRCTKCSCPKGPRCLTKKPCKFVAIKEPYKRGYKQKVTTQAKVPCGAWGWKLCTKTKVHYEMVYKTFYKTSYECRE